MTTPHQPAWAAILRALPAPLLAAAAVAADLPLKEPRQSEAQARQQLAALAATWHDAATFTRFGTPTVSFGPDCRRSHAVDESVSIDSLVDCSAAVALLAMRWCGVRA